MKNLKIFFLLFVFVFPVNLLAKESPSLLIDGGISTILGLKDTFYIRYDDQVSDGCLPQPSRMKDKMELVLRQNGFSILPDTKNSVFPDTIKISAVGYSMNDNSCAIFLEASLQFWINAVVPYAQNMPNGNHTFMRYYYSFGNVLLTGSKNKIQSRVENQIKDFAEQLYLDITRSKDQIKKDFPQILKQYKEAQSS